MNSQAVMPVPIRFGETIRDAIEDMYDQITRCAYEIFQRRGGNCTLDLEDWLTAERELLYKPAVHIEEDNRQIVVTVYIGSVSVPDIRLLVTPDAMLVQAHSGAELKTVFRTVQFPRRIDVSKAEAQYGDGCLILTA